MQERSIPAKVLLTETIRTLSPLLVFVLLLGVAHVVVYFVYGSSDLSAVVISAFFTFVFISAPRGSAIVRARRGIGLLTPAGGKAAAFCFAWGAGVAAGFIVTLQILQGMSATWLDYAVAMAVTGLCCSAVSAIPAGR
jgi:hypothetical protein